MASRLADRLKAARHRQFVGRTAERELFQSALALAEWPFFVLYVFGPGGIGKTTLLHEFARLGEQAQTHALYIDGRNVEPTPEAFENALQFALGLSSSDGSLQALAAQAHRFVLLIDTYETLAPLDGWLVKEFLPQLPENVLTVLAGRNPPSLAWRTDPGWQAFLHTLPLRNLSPDESQSYLTRREIPPERHTTVLDFTRGHPLALSLVADLFAQRPDVHFRPASAPDVIKTLLEQLVQKVPGPAHRTALEACALVRVTTEALLAEMLAMTLPAAPPGPTSSTPVGHGVHELFNWLRELSFIQTRPGGLFPHDLVRETLAVDLRWRNPDWYAELHRRARGYYTARLEQTRGREQQRALFDLIFLHRDNPVVRPFFEWQTSGTASPVPMQETDVPALVAMVARHEGEEAARLAAFWLGRQPEGSLVFHDADGQPAGFMAMVALHQAAAEDLEADPAARAAWGYLQRRAPLRSGEGATLFRFWMACETYQAVSPIQSLIFINVVRHYLATPGLAFTFFPCAEPDFWEAVFAYADLTRIPQADFELEGRRYGVYGHDWRAVPPTAWLSLLAEREISAEPQAVTPPRAIEALVVLSRPDFEEAVREALRHLRHPDLLRHNPLLRSRVVVARAGHGAEPAARTTILQSLVEEAAESLQASPRQVKGYRALYHTYFQPAPTQEQAAELLDLPFSTYRRHLQSGVTRVSEIMWQWEIGGPAKA